MISLYNKSSKRKYSSLISLAKSKKSKKLVLKNIRFLHCAKTNVTAASFLGYYDLKEMDTSLLLRKIKIPVIVLTASDDTVEPDLTADMKKAKRGKNIKLEVIDGASHFFRDLYLEDVVDSVTKFIK